MPRPENSSALSPVDPSTRRSTSTTTTRPATTAAHAATVREHRPQAFVQQRFAPRRAEPVPVVRALRVGNPEHDAAQADMLRAATEHFPGVYRSDAMIGVFENAKIEHRQLARPVEWYLEPRSFADKNAVYVDEALDLAERLATEALQDAGITPADVDAVVFVSSTGISTPSLDAYLIQRMGINPGVARLPLWGLGCAGGGAGLSRSADLVKAGYRNVLLVSVEFCSLTFQLGDESKSNFIGTALFADGGAAAVLGAADPIPGGRVAAAGAVSGYPTDDQYGDALLTIVSSHSTLVPDSAAMTGWDVVEEGFKLRLSPEIPTMMALHLRDMVDASLAEVDWTLDSIDTVVIHPGGSKVITGYELVLGLGEHTLDSARKVLREHGNMSSPTVLFVLAEALKAGPRGRGLISATGPGFCAEHLLVEFS
jgi:alkylresorcinol/alkylpyrone synthase